MTAQPSPRLSVVMPAYNEEGGIAEAVQAVQRHVFSVVPNAELVAVNDGSRDATGAILDELASRDARVRVVHKANGGHGPALISGLAAARGQFILLIDSDNQIPLESFARLWQQVQPQAAGAGRLDDGSNTEHSHREHFARGDGLREHAAREDGLSEYDAVFGVRRVRKDALLRRVLTRVIRGALTILFGVRLRDANVPFKLLRRDVWQAARPYIPEDTLAPSLFLAVFARKCGARIAYVDVAHRDRETGTVSIRRWKLIKFCARALRQLLAFRTALRRAPPVAPRAEPAQAGDRADAQQPALSSHER
ncbi:MAG: glycosyltransferase family 2 protein [Gemmatimonadaceae bacterium]